MKPSIPDTTSDVWSDLAPPCGLSTELVLQIESTATVRAACDLAELLDSSVDDAIAFALRMQLRRERALQPSPEQRLKAIHEFVTTLAHLPLHSDAAYGPALVPDDATPPC
ncbi:type II toxin-antitoxin system VapB family antitoxin [Conexibacter sp. JD483]|uniref:type II toxin-antitoxin system VapB family antitoxin n=1 Tax=unclassified Conexibacter TaxID=2627773 RepID=UPI00271A8CDE|nr:MULTISPECIES: type II toxin-antitoxin system VapB family antitoxin [unclassified Conexibacter]MDO8185497.1 type II toxin-antitoxin system VapB family antitoxin [Conexibacter sp. CPCC 205706]MDO8197316.1 type II toxin-antitoxin system VapB family antitoxin [Conexibacter sp. CPCC 205762]MDR9370184.1 type II toxin-antitoxin system VapB family antitoxin [Conexibacter sp. JD483]